MAFASAVNKQVAYKLETIFGTAPGASGAQLLRRVESTLTTKKDTMQSAEIRPDMQVSDFRHGIRKVDGTLKGEISPGTYKDFFAAAFRKLFVADTPSTGMSITIAAGTAPTYTLTRAAGSWISDGLNTFDIGRLTAGTFNAANSNKNLMVVAVSALVLTVIVLNGSTLVAEGPITGATWTPTGKKTFMPANAQLDQSFTIEHWFSDVAQSELFSGVKVNNFDITMPPAGMATTQFGLIGQDMAPAQAQYFAGANPLTSSGIVTAAGGILLAGSAPNTPLAICTGASIKCALNMVTKPVVGAVHVPAIFPGVQKVSGQFTAFFQDVTFRDFFLNETELSLGVALPTNGSAAADFVAIGLPRIKLSSADKSDAVNDGIVQTFNFEALLNVNGGTANYGDVTTMTMQDSLA